MQNEFLQSLFTPQAGFVAQEAILQAIILILLSSLMSLVYLFRGNSLSNRARLAALLPLMALTTMLIISIVKSSLALSLGLVGALSIVRFRAAIKDPEELAYIFLAISLGLGFGADQVAMTSTFFGVIIVFILIQSFLRGGFGKMFTDKDSVHVEINFSKEVSLAQVMQALNPLAHKIKLTRMDQGENNSMMFLLKPKSEKSLDELKMSLQKIDAKVNLTVLQYQPLV